MGWLARSSRRFGRSTAPLVGEQSIGRILHTDVEGNGESIHRARGTVSLDPPSRLPRLDPDVGRRGSRQRELDRARTRFHCDAGSLYLSHRGGREDAGERVQGLCRISEADVEIDPVDLLTHLTQYRRAFHRDGAKDTKRVFASRSLRLRGSNLPLAVYGELLSIDLQLYARMHGRIIDLLHFIFLELLHERQRPLLFPVDDEYILCFFLCTQAVFQEHILPGVGG